jgi:hypothetical protein
MNYSDNLEAMPDDDLDRLRLIAIQQYEQTWNEFYEWEQRHSLAAIQSLAVSDELLLEADEYFAEDLQIYQRPYPAPESRNLYEFIITTYDENGEELSEGQVLDSQVKINILIDKADDAQRPLRPLRSGSIYGSLEPYPAYHFCTPLATNVNSVDYSTDTAYFVPFADQSSFRLQEYLGTFPQIAWKDDFHDPDCE